MGVQRAQHPLGRRLHELEDGLQGVFLLGPVQFVAVNQGRRRVISRPPGRARPVHDLAIPEGNAHQVAHLHLPQAQRYIAPVNLPAGLDDAGGLADPAMSDHAGGQVGFGDNFLE